MSSAGGGSPSSQFFLPGFDFITGFVKSLVGFDPAFILNLGLLLAACSTVFHYTRQFVYSIASSYCIRSVEVEGLDPVYIYLMRWMTAHQIKTTSRTAKATARPQNSEADYEESPLFRDKEGSRDERFIDDGLQKEGPVNYRNVVEKLPLRFVPAGRYVFWHRGNLFVFQESALETVQKSDILDLHNRIHLSCWGRSLKPIRDLLRETQTEFYQASGSGSRIFKSISGPGGQSHWTPIVHRPVRGLNTVIIEETKKKLLIDDMNEYLHPATRKWYSNHGIPYRRGYLFSGAPGTGKTSLTFALAGCFGLDIYSISLADPDTMESELVQLFSTLPKRCIVLFEDIDAAGLRRIAVEENAIQQHTTAHRMNGRMARASRGGMSLSGLLNLIDGVSSHEGRVLIMTTNAPESLDPALIRPGRIDMHVQFQLATSAEIRQLFLAMYRNPTEDSTAASTSSSVALTDNKESSLPDLADDFAAMLPPDRLSLAAVQGHLLRYKHDPRKAVLNVQRWRNTVLGEEASQHASARKQDAGEEGGHVAIRDGDG